MMSRTIQGKSRTFCWLLTFLLLAGGLGGAAALAESPESSVGNVEAREVPAPVDPVRGTPEDEQGTVLPLAITNPELFKPLPLPNPAPRADGELPVPAGELVWKDLATGRVMREPTSELPFLPGVRPGGPGAYGSAEDDPAAKNFSALTRVTDTTAGRYPTAVKLYMTFQDATGGNHYFVGSGTLIDPLHVVTAGHCVYDHANYSVGYGWATSITVVPAYDAPDWPFGGVNAATLHSWVGWTVDGSLDHDVGVMSLTKPIGAVTGWRGYNYSDTFTYFTSPTWVHNGYPAASPYNGQYMYTQSGDFDGGDYSGGTWTGNMVSFNRQSYGGQSGSGAVRDDVVYAVLSNGNSVVTNDVRITSGKLTGIDQIIAAHKPELLDLVPLNCRAPTTAVPAGTNMETFNFLVHNYSTASVNTTYGFDVYLSTDDNITTADTRLGSYTFTWSFSPLSSVRVNFGTGSGPLIPASTARGTYYVGVILTYTDYNLANNDTDGWDAAQITVSQPDLLISSGTPTATPSTVVAGDQVALSPWTVLNAGDAPSGDFSNGFYLSSDPVITAGDLYLDGNGNYSLDPGASFNWGSPSPTIPPGTPPGNYHLGILVDILDEVTESNESNNYVSVPITVTAPLPDLTIASLTHSPANPTTVDLITFIAIVENIGDGPAAASTLELRVGGEGVGIYYPVPALPPGATHAVARQEVLSVAQGYVYEATADVNNVIAESVEMNNSRTATVVVSPAQEPTIEVWTLAPGPVSVRNSPNGGGQSLTSAQMWNGVPGDSPVAVDATIYIRVTDGAGTPIPNVPPSAFYLETTLGGLVPCGPMTLIADGPTDANGVTTISGPFAAGGYSDIEAGEQAVVVSGGTRLEDQALDIFFNSGDINGSGNVNLTDGGLFTVDLFGLYTYRSDFLWDGVINISDAGMMASMLGASCPFVAAKDGGNVADGSLGLYLDPQGDSAAVLLAGGQEFTAYVLLTGAVTGRDVGAWECGLQLSKNVELLSSELAASAYNLKEAPDFVVGAGRPLPAEPGRPLQLATLRLRTLDNEPASVRLRASSLASLGSGAAVVALGEDLELEALPITDGAKGSAIWLNDPDAPEWAFGAAFAANLDLRAAPNPFNPQTEIRFNLARPGEVTVRIYDVAGRLVRALTPGRLGSGPQAVVWDGKNADGGTSASGVYFGRLLLDGQVTGPTLKMSVIK